MVPKDIKRFDAVKFAKLGSETIGGKGGGGRKDFAQAGGQDKSKIDEAVSKHEENYVKSQSKVYKEWNDKREQDLEAQKENFEKQAKLQEIEQTKVKLDEKEKKLFFFDNYYDMEREKRGRIIEWRKKFPAKAGRNWGTPIKMGLKSQQEPCHPLFC